MTSRMRSIFLSVIIGTTAFAGALAYAQSTAPRAGAPLPAFTHPREVPADLAKIDKVLNNTASFSGRFAQYGSDGSFSQGKIYLKRPGKIRFEYDPPAALLMVSDGVTLASHDRKLDTLDRVPLKATPLNFFLTENVKLEDDVEIVAVQKLPGEIRVSAKDGSGQVDGTITMIFDRQSLNMREWLITDSFGGKTQIVLSDLKYNERLNPRLFILRDDTRRERRR